jgi:hypothetical protein
VLSGIIDCLRGDALPRRYGHKLYKSGLIDRGPNHLLALVYRIQQFNITPLPTCVRLTTVLCAAVVCVVVALPLSVETEYSLPFIRTTVKASWAVSAFPGYVYSRSPPSRSPSLASRHSARSDEGLQIPTKYITFGTNLILKCSFAKHTPPQVGKL